MCAFRTNERENGGIKATKGTRWMPWQSEAMKDAGACEKLRGAGKHATNRRCPNGETRRYQRHPLLGANPGN